MKIKVFQFNPFGVNSFVVWDETSHEAMVIDPGCYDADEEATLCQFIEDMELKVKYLVATHLHIDHILGTAAIVQRYEVPFMAHIADLPLLERSQGQAAMFGLTLNTLPAALGAEVNEGDCFVLGSTLFTAIHVPGHSPGSIVYYCEQEGVLISGDTLFRHSIGRTDLPQGSYEELINHIEHKLLTLPENTVVLPGHGEKTTIGYEKENNPYL